MPLKGALHVTQGLNLVEERSHLRHFVRIDEVVFEGPVLLAEEVVDLRRGELMGVAAIDVEDDCVSRFDVCRAGRHAPYMPRQDLLPHRHGTGRGMRDRNLDVAALDGLGEWKEAPFPDDELRDGVIAACQLVDGDSLSSLQTDQHVVIRHQQALIDVVAGVDWRERRGHGDADAAEDLALGGRLA